MTTADLSESDSISDEQATRMAQAGDDEGTAVLFRRYRAAVHRRVDRRIYDKSKVEDVASDVWARVMDRIDRRDPTASFVSWLYSIVEHVCQESWHDKSQPIPVELPDDHSPDAIELSVPGPATPVYGGLTVLDLSGVLDHLTPAKRDATVGHHGWCQTFAEVAAETGRNAHTVASDDRRALLSARRELEARRSISGALKRAG